MLMVQSGAVNGTEVRVIVCPTLPKPLIDVIEERVEACVQEGQAREDIVLMALALGEFTDENTGAVTYQVILHGCIQGKIVGLLVLGRYRDVAHAEEVGQVMLQRMKDMVVQAAHDAGEEANVIEVQDGRIVSGDGTKFRPPGTVLH